MNPFYNQIYSHRPTNPIWDGRLFQSREITNTTKSTGYILQTTEITDLYDIGWTFVPSQNMTGAIGYTGPTGPYAPLSTQSDVITSSTTLNPQTTGGMYSFYVCENGSLITVSEPTPPQPTEGINPIISVQAADVQLQLTGINTTTYMTQTGTNYTQLVSYNPSNWLSIANIDIYTPPFAQMSGPTDTIASQGFDIATSQYGSHVVVGAPFMTGGSCYTYNITDGNGWVFQNIFTNETTPFSAFGATVAMDASGSIIVVGAPLADSFNGRVHAYKNNTLVNTIYTTPPITNAVFGSALALNYDGIFLAVGASGENNGQGSVYIYTYPYNSLFQRIQPPDIIGYARFGTSVDMDSVGLTLVIGGPDDDSQTTIPPVGAFWVYARPNTASLFTYVSKSPNIPPLTSVGYSVSINSNGTIIVAGAPSTSGGIGGATVYKDGVYNVSVLPPTTPFIEIGSSVNISKNGKVITLIGTEFDSDSLGGAIIYTDQTGARYEGLTGVGFGNVATNYSGGLCFIGNPGPQLDPPSTTGYFTMVELV